MRIILGILLAMAVTGLGFWPSFFSNPAQNDAGHLIHGIFATGWLVIILVQVSLMKLGHVRPHHLIGRASVLWVIGLIVTALNMVHVMLSNREAHSLPLDLRLTLGFIDLTSLSLFTGFYAASIVFAFRRDIWAHQRLMIATLIVALIPALGRVFAFYVPGIAGLAGALPPTFFCLEAVLIGLIGWDGLHDRRASWPYGLALVGLVGIHLSMFEAPHCSGFVALARLMGYPA